MLFRFSLYGFLKNQRYFEPFFALALLERGMSFSQLGLLIGLREVCTNLLEVPSGAAADAYGRRRCMVVSFSAYIASFVVLGFGATFWQFAAAMLLYGVGDAFRSGTHKAMIFEWLRRSGREGERTRVYGYTRSWSKIGSALSSLLAGGFVLYTGRYADVFFAAIPPYLLNLINLATYPRELEGARRGRFHPGEVWRRTWETARVVAHRGRLRLLMIESMGFEGTYDAVKDYLQPVLVALALSLPLLTGLELESRTAILAGVVYSLLFLLSGAASRQAHRFEARHGGTEPAAARLWWWYGATFAALLPLSLAGRVGLAAVCFVVLGVLQNLWRPILITRIDASSDADAGATVMSVEEQSRSVATMVLAPALGFVMDLANAGIEGPARNFWPVAGCGIAAILLVASVRRAAR
jgi:MFS family permease